MKKRTKKLLLIQDSSLFDQLEEFRVQRAAEAQAAWERGQGAFAGGDDAEASRWLERAGRFAPQDDTIRLVLAMVRLRNGAAEAADLFRQVLARHDIRTAWLGLAASLLRSGNAAAAGEAMQAALSRHAGAIDAALADDVAAAIHAPGWCALLSGGVLKTSAPSPTIRLDGRPVRLGVTGALPASWRRANRLEAAQDGRSLLGSPISLDRISAVQGVVERSSDGMVGWAWHPADPETAPVLTCVAPGRTTRFTAELEEGLVATGLAPLARPRRFRLSVAGSGAVRITGPDGRDLLGSPIHLEPPLPSPAPRTRRRSQRVTVVVPVHGSPALTLACIDSVLRSLPSWAVVQVVDDASAQPELVAALDRLAAARRIRLLRNPANAGFPATANRGLAAAPGDAVLLNSDTLVSPGWLERLRDAAWSGPGIGTVTPLSNDATILSYPSRDGGNPIPHQADTDRLAALAWRANGARTIPIPTAVGFCMYIRRDCLDAVGPLREDVFAQGYGEENDFCMRAADAGWVHAAAPGVFVGHVGGGSFGAATTHLLTRNLAILNRLHPGYDALVAAHVAADPLASSRRRIDRLRWPRAGGAAVLLVTHDMGGGVQRQVEARIDALSAEGLRPIVLRPVLNQPGWCRLDDGRDRSFPNLRFRLPGEAPRLAQFLAAQQPVRAELHHLVGHAHDVVDLCVGLRLPYEVHIHDYAWFCERISLIGPLRRYCGEPGPDGCVVCIAEAGRNIEEEISPADLLRRSAIDLAGATKVIAPSADAATRLRRHFPGLAIAVRPWEDEPIRAVAAPDPPASGRRRICVVGAIGIEKGFDVLLACANDTAARNLALEFVVVGYTIDDAKLHATGRVFVTGLYTASELPELITRQGATLAFLPSIWPETWCFALSEAWRAGLPVAAFDMGAPAERIRRHGGGLLLPLGLPPPAINDVLLAARHGAAPAAC